jgi:hypothetical protein
MLGRRLLILVAVLMGLTALAASVTPQPQTRRGEVAGTPTPTPSPTPAASAAPATQGVVVRHIDASRAHAPVTIEVARGQRLELRVTVTGADAVSLDDLEIEAADVRSDAVLELFADAPGSYPVRLLSGRTIGTVRVSE